MGRLVRSLLWIAVAAAILHAVFLRQEPGDFPQPRRGVPEAFRAPGPPLEPFPTRPLPPPSVSDPRGVIDVPTRQGDTQGTASSIDPKGLWLTARHVVEGCAEVRIEGYDRWVRARVAALHPETDLAVLSTRGAPPALPPTGPGLNIGQTAWAVGYPKSVPSVVEGTLLGRGRIGLTGRMRGEASVTVWVEKRRTPPGDGPLSGISGGPLVDSEARLIGVAIAATDRRGRFYAASPENIQDMLARLPPGERPAPAAAIGVRFDGDRAPQFGSWAMGARTVTRVTCRAR
ncbi:MAG: trypsin-like peptidase domain-containing protein [Alphaproteobacteria bacterium]|nr:trypsin-like peptidase domain-containing protein [Alphaproteobacteria bacterium]